LLRDPAPLLDEPLAFRALLRDEPLDFRAEPLDLRDELLDFRAEPLDLRLDELLAFRALLRDEPLDFRAEPPLFRDEELELRDLLLERLLERLVARSDAGISSWTTALVSVSICPATNLAIRSSSRRMPRASCAVSLSPTAFASTSMAL
jgi:hypothetical protein